MQKEQPLDGQDLMKEMEDLILSIKSIKPALTEEEIAKEVGYNDKAISQARSRGVTQKFLNSLRSFSDRLQNVTIGGANLEKVVDPETENDLRKSILHLTEATNRHSIIDERNSRTMERLVALLAIRMGIDASALNSYISTKDGEDGIHPNGEGIRSPLSEESMRSRVVGQDSKKSKTEKESK